MSASTVESRRWLFGPVPDLLFGCGLAWILVFGLRAIWGDGVAAWVPGPLLILLFAVPHYGATLALVYEQPETRRKYKLFAVHASLLLALAFAVSVRSALVGSIILTVYLTWSPWHYTGQNYGIFLTLLGRRGERPDARLKRWIYASFVTSYALTFLSMHGAVRATYAPVSYAGSVYRLMPLAIPNEVSSILLALAAAGYGVSTLVALSALLRRNGLRALAPCILLLVTQALWFSVPAFIRQWRLFVGDPGSIELYSAYGFLWIAAAHSTQYLWFCTYYATGARAPARAFAYLGKSVLGGYAIWILPGVLFAPALLGGFPAESGLTLMVAAVVNLHHFVLDGAIWKLRDGRIARILLRGEAEQGADEGPARGMGARGFAVAIAMAGILAFSVVIANHVESEYGFKRSLRRGDLDRADVALTRLAWIGNDSPSRRVKLGRRYAESGNMTGAVRQFQASLELHPTAAAWRSMAQVHEQGGRLRDAEASYRAALQLDPRHVKSLIGAGSLYIRSGRSDLALPYLERAARIDPDDPQLATPLRRARRDMGVGAEPG